MNTSTERASLLSSASSLFVRHISHRTEILFGGLSSFCLLSLHHPPENGPTTLAIWFSLWPTFLLTENEILHVFFIEHVSQFRSDQSAKNIFPHYQRSPLSSTFYPSCSDYSLLAKSLSTNYWSLLHHRDIRNIHLGSLW